MTPFTLSHSAPVVESLAATTRRLGSLAPRSAPIEEQPTEGTREQYVGPQGARPCCCCASRWGPADRTAARSRVHTLVELCEMPEREGGPFVTEAEIPMAEPDQELIARLGLPGRPLQGVSAVGAGPAGMPTLGGRRFDLRALARADS